MAGKITLPYEQEARRGLLTPDQCRTPIEQMCYIATANLYKLFNARLITTDAAGAQKQEMAGILDDYCRMDSLRDRQTEWAENAVTKCEQAITRYNHWRLTHQDVLTGDTAILVEILDTIVNVLHPKNPEPKEEPHEGFD